MAVVRKKPRGPITARTLALAQIKGQHSRFEFTFPNVYPHIGWGEADVLGVRPSGYVDEIEIKISHQDFLADFDKTVNWTEQPYKTNPDRKRRVKTLKHDQLKARDCFPNRFSFLVSPDLVDKIEVPEYAGLMTISEGGYLIVVKEAPVLHKNKIDKDTQIYLYKKLAYRYLDQWKEQA